MPKADMPWLIYDHDIKTQQFVMAIELREIYMSNSKSNDVLNTILEKIELPDSAYEKAEKRYKDLGDWLHRPESTCVNFDPHVFLKVPFV